MDIEKINKQIQQEREHHTKTINRLKKEICKQNERHQSTMSYLQNQKTRAMYNNKALENCNNFIYKKADNINKLCELIEQANEEIRKLY